LVPARSAAQPTSRSSRPRAPANVGRTTARNIQGSHACTRRDHLRTPYWVSPAQARVAPNSTSDSRPKSRRVKPCPISTAEASLEPCWAGSPPPAAQASWLQQQRARLRSLALPPRHRRQHRAPSKRCKALWSGRVGGGTGGAGGGTAAAFAVGAGSSPTRLHEAAEFRRAGASRRYSAAGPAIPRRQTNWSLGSPTTKGERTPLSGFPSMSIGRKGGQEWLNRNERG
jgi:hypothetical protein